MITDEQKATLSPMPYWDDYLCFPQPCWHNIYPGKTTKEDASAIIQADPNLRITGIVNGMILFERINSQGGGLISGSSFSRLVFNLYINEAYENELRLKDAILIYGNPLALHYCFSEGLVADGIYVYFPSNIVARVYDRLNPLTREIYPDSSIVQMEYSASDLVPTDHPWAGYSEEKPSL